ncbi:glycosyl hydrolase family 18 protein [Carboxylicivirga marina]|uniref:chitinase n=1 Tax=Carboxylicivirga marina TaxID=2800988 RepID=A0ABS1HE53_9BACT|nr:glycosyl hydrolase family 18 protein [Carboxylicivirga marina]MBK3515898.1 hypothetical protein [Carboxylicivirga marina]
MKSLLYLFVMSIGCSFAIQSQNKVVGYIPQRSVKAINTETFKRITEAIYFGLDVDENGKLDIEKSRDDLNYLDSVRQIQAVDLSVCFGGWGRSDFFAPVCASDQMRSAFCKNVLQLCMDYQLQGIDLDWEYPKNEAQLNDYVSLVKELHEVLQPHDIGISIAVGFWDKQAGLVSRMEPYLKGINLMTYDNVSPCKGHASYTLVKRAVKRFIKHGIPAGKLFVGVPFYGRHRWQRQKTMAYREVPGLDNSISKKGLYKGYFFDTSFTLKRKQTFIKENRLGGIMIWELGHDIDCTEPNSLLNAIDEFNK